MSILWVALFAFTVFVAPDNALAVRVTLKRIVFEGPKRTETLTIMNQDSKAVTYRIGWRRFRMTEDSALKAVPDDAEAPDLKEAKDMIRYAPRRVTIPPGGSQQIRLMLRRPRDLPDGEYRSHIWIVPEADVAEFNPNPEPVPDGKSAVQLAMLTGISLPVFVRNGKLTATGKLADPVITRDGDKLKLEMVIEREGDRSLYGDMDFVCNGGGAEKVLTQIRGIAVYTEVSKRKVHFDLPYPEGGAAACPNIKVLYRSDKEDTYFNGETISEINVPFKG